jgi:hypothetical protein
VRLECAIDHRATLPRQPHWPLRRSFKSARRGYEAGFDEPIEPLRDAGADGRRVLDGDCSRRLLRASASLLERVYGTPRERVEVEMPRSVERVETLSLSQIELCAVSSNSSRTRPSSPLSGYTPRRRSVRWAVPRLPMRRPPAGSKGLHA